MAVALGRTLSVLTVDQLKEFLCGNKTELIGEVGDCLDAAFLKSNLTFNQFSCFLVRRLQCLARVTPSIIWLSVVQAKFSCCTRNCCQSIFKVYQEFQKWRVNLCQCSLLYEVEMVKTLSAEKETELNVDQLIRKTSPFQPLFVVLYHLLVERL